MSSRVAESVQRSLPEPKKRNLFSCDECRHDKKACYIPPTQDGGEKSPSCVRCLKKHLICSGPVYIPRKPKSVVKMVVAVDEQPVEDEELSTQRDRDTNYQNIVTSQTNPARHPSVARPMEPCWGLAATTSSDDDVPDPKQVLVQLGNLNAVRELLRSCMYVCEDVCSWRSGCTIVDRVQTLLQSITASVQANFMNLLGQADVDAERLNAHQASELWVIMTRFQHPPNRPAKHKPSNINPQDLESVFDRINKRQFAQQRTDEVYSVADHLCHEVCTTMSSGKMLRLGHDRRRLVQGAYEAIDKILKDIQIARLHNTSLHAANISSTEDLSSASLCFPLLHLTLLQADDDILRFFAQRNSKRLFEVDLLGRTVFHLAAYFGRTSFVEMTLEDHRDKTVLSAIKQDAFKLYPHMIAACRNDIEAVKLFVKHGANLSAVDANNQTCLDLAVQTDATDVVRWLLQNGHGNRSFGNPLRQAVELMQFGIVNVYVEFYSVHDYHNYDDIVDAAELAEEMGLRTVAAQLRELDLNRPSYQALALESFTTLEFQNGYNMPSIDAPTTQMTPYALPNSQFSYGSAMSPFCDPFSPHMRGPNGLLQPPDHG